MSGQAVAVTGDDLRQAYRQCWKLARGHYENFTVGSWLLPRPLRQHLAAVYAFARTADDVADEGNDAPAVRLARLDAIEAALEDAYTGRPAGPIFIALADTVRTFGIPVEPFRRLLHAFRRDVEWREIGTDDELLRYCEGSANPVGHLVLYLFGYRDAARQALADRVCTGLQLANFWQDLAQDVARGRVYLPTATLVRFGGDRAAIARGEDAPALRRCLAAEVERARNLLIEGTALAGMVEPRLAREVRMFAAGGLAILGKIAALDYDMLRHRPKLSRREQARVVLGTVLPLPPPVPRREPTSLGYTTALREATEYCHAVTQRSSSNFAYAFRLMAPERRAALEAVYAFCRFIDDVADDADRQNPAELLSRWRDELDRVYDGQPTHQIGIALADAVRRFPLGRQHFLDLITGVETDLCQTRYESFADLRQYCYRVASTVGLLCIEIFGYRQPTARDYAVDLGIAFQLTNILRDVMEDAQRGRIYLPLEDLRTFEVDEAALLAGAFTPRLGALMAFECGRARAFYLRAQGALAAEDRGPLAPAEAMRSIYTRLLGRIEARHFDVFGARVTLPAYEKVGLALAAWGRAQLGAFSG
jgi:squalene synthase HpnC/squalene synthase HpnD